MSKNIAKIALISVVASLMMPTMVSAERAKITLKKQDDQQYQNSAARLDPYSAETETLLAELGIELQPVDPIWQNPDFAYFLDLMKQVEVYDLQGDTVNAIYTLFEAVDVMDSLNHRELVLEKEDREFFNRLRTVIEENTFAFEADPEYFLFEQTLILLGEELEQSFQEYEQNLGVESIYAYANPGGFVYAGEVVQLHLSTTAPEGLSVSWRQTYGPNVEWLTTSSDLAGAFIVPEGSEGDSIIIEYTVSRLGQQKRDELIYKFLRTHYQHSFHQQMKSQISIIAS